MGFIVTVKKDHPTGIFRRGGHVFTTNPTFLDRLPSEVRTEIESPTGWLEAEKASRPPQGDVGGSRPVDSVETDASEGEGD